MAESTASGAGSIAVAVAGNGNDITISVNDIRLTLDRLHLQAARWRAGDPSRRTERDLLIASNRAISLQGRTAELDLLTRWRDSAPPISFWCITGRGGAGKTRLGIELCEAAATQGWDAGFIREAELRRFVAGEACGNWRWRAPTLLVVDYAAGSLGPLKEWLTALAALYPSAETPRLRLLLLERHADGQSGWWNSLTAQTSLSNAEPASLLHAPEPLELAALDAVTARRAVLGEAMTQAAALAGKPAPLLPAPGADPAFDARLADDSIEKEPLYLAMAGVVAAREDLATALALDRGALAHNLAAREAARLERLAVGWGWPQGDTSFPLHVAACLTLQGGCPASDLEALIREEREAIDARPSVSDLALAQHLLDHFAAAGRAEAIRPDLIGEAFLLARINRPLLSAERQQAIITRCWQRDKDGSIQSLIRIAQDYAAFRDDHASVAWLRGLLAQMDDFKTLLQLANAMPEQTLALRELAAEVEQRIADKASLAGRDDADSLNLRAMSLNNLANRLSALGRSEEALQAAQDAVDIRRNLAAQRFDVFRPRLSSSLNNLATKLSDLGRREEALLAAREAVDIRRDLAAQRPDSFQSDLAMSLINLASTLSDLGHREEALQAVRDAVEIYRDLEVQRPEALRPTLAVALYNLATALAALGRFEEALQAAQETLDIIRDLAAQRPDAFRPDLAKSLNNLSNRLSALGQREAALQAAEDAVEIYRDLATQRPEAFQPEFASSLNSLAARLGALGRNEEALVAGQEVLDIFFNLAAKRPDAFRPNLAMSLNNLAHQLSALGQPEAALQVAHNAYEIYCDLAAQRPAAFRPDLAKSLAVLGLAHDGLGQRDKAIACFAEAIATLAPSFLALPQAHAGMMLQMVRDYRQRCQAADVAPDSALLDPVFEILIPLIQQQESPDA